MNNKKLYNLQFLASNKSTITKHTMMPRGFTLIEIIVVISISVLLTTSGAFYFNNFLGGIKIKSDISNINSRLEEFDDKVKSKEIFDYEIYLKPGEIGFYYYENKFDLDNFLKISDLDFYSGTGVLELDDNSPSRNLQLLVYNDSRFISEKVLDSSEEFTFYFSKYSNYKVVSSLSDKLINSIGVSYFSESKLESGTEDFLILEEILDENDSPLVDILVKNIGGRKTIGSGNSKITLIFENNGRKEKLVISE